MSQHLGQVLGGSARNRVGSIISVRDDVSLLNAQQLGDFPAQFVHAHFVKAGGLPDNRTFSIDEKDRWCSWDVIGTRRGVLILVYQHREGNPSASRERASDIRRVLRDTPDT